ncbi:hypothetical protein ACIBW9_10690 [Streptomyces sp. NPDC049541]
MAASRERYGSMPTVSAILAVLPDPASTAVTDHRPPERFTMAA